MNKKLFIFDLDGTLVDAYRAIEESLNFTRQKFSYPAVSYSYVKKNVGRGDKRFIQAFFPTQNRNEALRMYRSHHASALRTHVKLMPSVKRVLSHLKRKKKILAVASNRPRKFTQILISQLEIKKYFDMVVCADQIRSLKPNPKILNMITRRMKIEKDDTVYVGDMDIDMETARRAGIDAVFVKGGSGFIKEVKKYNNKKVIADLSELLHLYHG